MNIDQFDKCQCIRTRAHINTHIDMHTLTHGHTHTHTHAYCSKTPDERPPHEVGMELVQLSARSGALPMHLWVTAQCSNDFSPRACFQCRLSYNIRTAWGAIACSNTCAHNEALVAIPLVTWKHPHTVSTHAGDWKMPFVSKETGILDSAYWHQDHRIQSAYQQPDLHGQSQPQTDYVTMGDCIVRHRPHITLVYVQVLEIHPRGVLQTSARAAHQRTISDIQQRTDTAALTKENHPSA